MVEHLMDISARPRLNHAALQAYYTRILEREPEEGRADSLAWRMSCFDAGHAVGDLIEHEHFPLRGRTLLDAASGWGGHVLALATRGAQVVAADLNDHAFSDFKRFTAEYTLPIDLLRANCEQLSFRDESFDVILALELIEHIDSVDAFAREVSRLLKPGGVCLLSTPPRFRSLVEGEPHYQLRGLTALPFSWQRFVATKLFGRTYPFPIPRQYATAGAVIRLFERYGVRGRSVVRGPKAQMLSQFGPARRMLEALLWSFIVLKKPPR